MANELEITHTKDSIIIRCLDENIFNDKVNHYLNNGYQLAEKVVTNKFGLKKAILKKLTSNWNMSEILIKGATIFLLLPLTFILSTHTIDVLRGRRKIKRGLLSQIISTLFALIIIAISVLIVIQIFFVSPKKDTKKVLTAFIAYNG